MSRIESDNNHEERDNNHEEDRIAFNTVSVHSVFLVRRQRPVLAVHAMFLRTYTPGPPLEEYIERFWYCSDTPSHPRERILPSGTVELVINLSDDEIRIYDPSDPARPRRYPGAVVSGPYSNFFLIDPLVHASIIGVHFRPGRAVPVLGVAASDLADAHVDLEALWGQWLPNCANGFARLLRRRNDLPCWKKCSSGACARHRRGTAPYRLRSTHSSKPTRP